MSVFNLEEAIVTINGLRLTDAQVMSIRVAVESMRMDLADPERRAELGGIGDGYAIHLRAVSRMLVKGRPVLQQLVEEVSVALGRLRAGFAPDGNIRHEAAAAVGRLENLLGELAGRTEPTQ